MKQIIPVFSVLLFSCVEKSSPIVNVIQNNVIQHEETPASPMKSYYLKHNNDSLISVSTGTAGNGKLKNAVLFPPKGANFKYFSEGSYLKGRAFINSEVNSIVIAALKELEKTVPEQTFQIMEISHQHGGELWPHRTHQKGTSVDFMLPKQKNGKIDYSLDDKGVNHYFLATDNDGMYLNSGGVKVNFETTAQQILAINESANLKGWKIKKVIFKIELQDDLFKTKTGKILKSKNIYFVKHLSKKVNDIHDDHFHIDFEKKNKT